MKLTKTGKTRKVREVRTLTSFNTLDCANLIADCVKLSKDVEAAREKYRGLLSQGFTSAQVEIVQNLNGERAERRKLNTAVKNNKRTITRIIRLAMIDGLETAELLKLFKKVGVPAVSAYVPVGTPEQKAQAVEFINRHTA